MKVVETIELARKSIREARKAGKSIGLVPTMGALHAGHLSLIEHARKRCDFVAVSIFVNPTQFGPNEDYERYPRDISSDTEMCREAKVDLLFAPAVEQMYPEPQMTWVHVDTITDKLCGQFRPDHFRGVTTVCSKLFNIVEPDAAFFGQKDAQQVTVIRRMVRDLNIPLEIVVCPTVREIDGLAVSSRNLYMPELHRKEATLIYHALTKCRDMVSRGYDNCRSLIGAMRNILSASSLIEIEYIKIVDMDSLEEIEIIKDKALAAIAVRIGSTRLIDNIILEANMTATA